MSKARATLRTAGRSEKEDRSGGVPMTGWAMDGGCVSSEWGGRTWGEGSGEHDLGVGLPVAN